MRDEFLRFDDLQHGFPLQPRPYQVLAARLGLREHALLALLARGLHGGRIRPRGRGVRAQRDRRQHAGGAARAAGSTRSCGGACERLRRGKPQLRAQRPSVQPVVCGGRPQPWRA